jgi:hypothetical protein
LKAIALAVFFTVAILPLGWSTTFVNRPIGDVVKEADSIVRGRTGDAYSDWGKTTRQIFTYTNFVVTEVLKGKISETKILLRQPGGSKDGMEMGVPGAASFSPGEDVVVLLGKKNQDDGSYDVPGLATGKFNIVAGDNGEPTLVNSLGGGAIYDPNKDPRTLSYNARIPLEVFKRVAHGEDVPEASHKQFEESKKPAPPGSYESDHDSAHKPDPKKESKSARSGAGADPNSGSQIQNDTQASAEQKASSWVPLSFIALAAIGAFALWFFLRSKG